MNPSIIKKFPSLMFAAGLVLGYMMAFLSLQPAPDQQKTAPHWEYGVERLFSVNFSEESKKLLDQLNDLGKEGWVFAGLVRTGNEDRQPIGAFKRPMQGQKKRPPQWVYRLENITGDSVELEAVSKPI